MPPPEPVSLPGPDQLFALVFKLVFQIFVLGFGFQIGATLASFHKILASFCRAWILHGCFIDFGMDIGLMFDVV